jgi:hypothetical protein
MPRLLFAALLGLAVAGVAACGDDDSGDDTEQPDAMPSGDLLDRLNAIPQVTQAEELSTNQEGYRYFTIRFDQPVDHEDPGGQHFIQFLTLIHRDERLPLVLGSTGYGNYYGDYPMEPTSLLQANQLIIEHRYFSPSRPDPTDWSFLTTEQGAADHHAIAEAFHRIYEGPWISTGGSKGGMTSIYHRHLYPDDVDGTVAYVAPYNQADGDTRYDGWFDEVLPADCLQRVRDAQVDFLTNRREALVERATQQAEDSNIPYTRVTIPAAVESAVVDAEWSFFQYTGVTACDAVPGPEASDDDAWFWLQQVNSVDGLSDGALAFFEPYYYQAYAELGYPTTEDPHLDGLLEFTDEDYAGAEPAVHPEYQPSAVDAAADWVRDEGERLLFLYGEFDPWTAGAFDLGTNPGATRFTVAEGTHGSRLIDLPDAERAASFDLLEEWTGVTPTANFSLVGSTLRALAARARPREPRLPIHALSRAHRHATQR